MLRIQELTGYVPSITNSAEDLPDTEHQLNARCWVKLFFLLTVPCNVHFKPIPVGPISIVTLQMNRWQLRRVIHLLAKFALLGSDGIENSNPGLHDTKAWTTFYHGSAYFTWCSGGERQINRCLNSYALDAVKKPPSRSDGDLHETGIQEMYRSCQIGRL